MEIRGARVLILGGSGLVGMAIAREMLPLQPSRLIISGLTQAEADDAVRELSTDRNLGDVELIGEWGDIFLAEALKDRGRRQALADADSRRVLLDDLFGPLDSTTVERSALGALLLRHRPDVIVDCINTATVVAYQNIFASVSGLLEKARTGSVEGEAVEQHLATLYLPQLIRHVQIALDAMRRAETKMYVKIGTAGTGGMGLNIPFTHSEERPSRMLLAKSSVAGAHTLLLYLMARTPGAPAVKEIKPTAAISWKRIGSGEVRRGGRPIRRIDSTQPLALSQMFEARETGAEPWQDTGEALHGVFLDAGENGLFSPGEFEALTALGLMEFITPEEIAKDVVREVSGHPTGHDVIGALDSATSGPTYRAGVLRHLALDRMDQLEREQNVESVAYEMLGPPRLSKLLFEAALLRRLFPGLRDVGRLDPQQTAQAADDFIRSDEDFRSRILSIGLPILLADGERVLRGPEIRVTPGDDDARRDPNRIADAGWVDLRPSNWERWRQRAETICHAHGLCSGADGGTRAELEGWLPDDKIRPGSLAAWIFRHEDQGERIKR
jgi:NAD(P)-dependent dehydrogenase (short-subunit alcohol dehydrogenase family)